MNIRVFLQSELLSDIEVIELPQCASTMDLRNICAKRLPSDVDTTGVYFFVENEDDDEAVDSLASVPNGLRVHAHRLKKIKVQVRYAGHVVNRVFRPSASIGRIKKWATRELGISPSDAAELMLQISGSDIRPDKDVHVGSLVCAPKNSIVFDLVPSPRINGGPLR